MAITPLLGTITRVFLPRGFAFIRGDDGLDYFFQADELRDRTWEGSTVRGGARALFTPSNDGTKGNGLRATEVRLC